MKILAYVLASLSILVGAILSVLMFVMVIAGAANTPDNEEWKISAWMWGIAGGGFLCFVLGIVLTCLAKPMWGAAIGGIPILFLCGFFVWMIFNR